MRLFFAGPSLESDITMMRLVEFAAWMLGGIVRHASSASLREAGMQRLADTFDEFARRLRRAGLLFIVIVAGLLLLSIIHPVALILWLIALPLAGFGSFLSLMWPTRRALKTRPSRAARPTTSNSMIAKIARMRSDMPVSSRPAFDLVLERLKGISALVGDERNTLLADEANRLVCGHLPRLLDSYCALPRGERTPERADALTNALGAIAEELADLSLRLQRARADRFETEGRFIASRFPTSDLASV